MAKPRRRERYSSTSSHPWPSCSLVVVEVGPAGSEEHDTRGTRPFSEDSIVVYDSSKHQTGAPKAAFGCRSGSTDDDVPELHESAVPLSASCEARPKHRQPTRERRSWLSSGVCLAMSARQLQAKQYFMPVGGKSIAIAWINTRMRVREAEEACWCWVEKRRKEKQHRHCARENRLIVCSCFFFYPIVVCVRFGCQDHVAPTSVCFWVLVYEEGGLTRGRQERASRLGRHRDYVTLAS